MKEDWKEVVGFANYECNSSGQVRSKKTSKILKPSTHKKGYLQVVLYVNSKKSYTRKIHRLVALTFIDNPYDLPEVNHKDENKTNNCVDNLEWCTGSYNMEYSFGIECHLLSPDKILFVTNNLNEFARQNGLIQGNLWRVVNGDRKSHRGWTVLTQ